VPTRGQIKDIGPGLSHKAKVIQLYLWGLQFTDIESRTHHSEGSIRRYLADFRQIAALYARGAKLAEIRAATGRSAALIAEYIALYERARREFPAAPRLYDLLDVERAKAKRAAFGEGREPKPHRLPPTLPPEPALAAALQVPPRVRLRQGRSGGAGHRRGHLQGGAQLLRPPGRPRAGPARLPRPSGDRAGWAGQDDGQDQARAGAPDDRRRRGPPRPSGTTSRPPGAARYGSAA
jgi:hypothetical protein